MNLTPSQIGQITELKCQQFFLEHGWNVSIPVGNYCKYDMLIENGSRIYKIQCKHATELETGFLVRTRYDKRVNGKVIKETYKIGNVDYMMTEYKGKFYLFPPFGTQEVKFWTVPTNHSLSKLAKDFNAEDILQRM